MDVYDNDRLKGGHYFSTAWLVFARIPIFFLWRLVLLPGEGVPEGGGYMIVTESDSGEK